MRQLLLKKVFQTEKATECFRRHEAFESHKEAVVKLQSLHSPIVIEQISSDATKTRAQNGKMLLMALSSPRFLLRQGVAIQGHHESEGNLMQLLQLRSFDNPSPACSSF